MGLYAFGVEYRFVAEAGFAGDFRLQREGDPFLGSFSLYKAFAGVVEVDAAVFGDDGNLSVRHVDGFVFGVGKMSDQFFLLFGR